MGNIDKKWWWIIVTVIIVIFIAGVFIYSYFNKGNRGDVEGLGSISPFAGKSAFNCQDSDGGNNYNAIGEIRINNSLVWQDYCSRMYLYEGYCDSGTGFVKAIYTYCSKGCSNGACRGAYTTTGSIYATSVPSGASFYVDNVLKGTTPLNVTNVTAGSRSVKFTKSGYQNYTTTATVTAGQITQVNAILNAS